MEQSLGEASERGADGSKRDATRIPSPLFLAKLRPPTADRLVLRPRLIELLRDALEAPIVVVAAPAGSGKTSLLASWAAQTRHPLAWLSLDEGDRELVRLWTGVLASIDTLAPGVTTTARALLAKGTSLEEVVAALLTELERTPLDDAVLVLDDIHVIDDVPEGAKSIATLASYLPDGFHMVLIGRRRPRLAIDRLRARGRLREVSFEELQFSAKEAAEVLRRLAPGMDASDVAALTDRAAGWVASIQFSGLAAQAARAGSGELAPGHADRLTDDYLWHEVLADESPEVMAVLNAASLVERIHGDLARAITGQEDAAAALEDAADRELFLTRLSEPGWFAQHAVVRDLLHRDLRRSDPRTLSEMHARAAAWYENAGEPTLAVRHWMKSARVREALHAVAVSSEVLYDEGRESVVVQAISELPTSLPASDLDAALDYAWAHVLVDRRVLLDTVDRIGELADGRELDATTSGRVQIMTSIAAVHRGDWEDVGSLAIAALDDFGTMSWTDPLGRFGWNLVARGLALTEAWSDQSEPVRRAARMVTADRQRLLAFEATRALGLALHGTPVEALGAVERATELANGSVNRSLLHLELSLAAAIAHRELGERDRSAAELATLVERPLTPLPYIPFRAALELAESAVAAGDVDKAERMLATARKVMAADFGGPASAGWAESTETVVALAAGQPRRAEKAAMHIDDPVWRPISLARVRLAQDDPSEAATELRDVRPRSIRQEVIVDLLRSRAASSRPDAVEAFRHAAALAATHGLVQTVAAECQPASGLLEHLERVAEAVPEPWLDHVRHVSAQQHPYLADVPAGTQTLTERERDVLRMLPSRLTVNEIADELYLSRNTVKFHLKVIYRKLGCSSRAEAAAIARAMTRRPIT